MARRNCCALLISATLSFVENALPYLILYGLVPGSCSPTFFGFRRLLCSEVRLWRLSASRSCFHWPRPKLLSSFSVRAAICSLTRKPLNHPYDQCWTLTPSLQITLFLMGHSAWFLLVLRSC